MIELFYHPQAFYVLPCVLLEWGTTEDEDSPEPYFPEEHSQVTLAWFIWTLEITI